MSGQELPKLFIDRKLLLQLRFEPILQHSPPYRIHHGLAKNNVIGGDVQSYTLPGWYQRALLNQGMNLGGTETSLNLR